LPDDTRPGYFNALHGIDIDLESGRVYVSDRMNNRIQVFDQDGNFLDQWRVGDPPSDVQYLIVANGAVWIMDAGTTKLLKYGLDGQFLDSWGTWGSFPGGMWGVHGMTVDEEGNFYISEVNNGRVQKFVPRDGADPDRVISRVHPTY
jgi:sugar lactone lactonase YvrE